VLNRYGGIFGKIPAPGAGGSGDGFGDEGYSLRTAHQPKPCTIQDPYASKKHFQVIGDSRGRFFIADLGSLNGTFIRRNFDPALAGNLKLFASGSPPSASAAMAVAQQQAALAARGVSPVMCTSPMNASRQVASPAACNSPAPTTGREGWGAGSWEGGSATQAAALSPPGYGSSSDLSGLSGSVSGSTSVSGYASVSTQWLNTQVMASNSGYRLTKHSVFLLGKSEILVLRIHDIDNPLPSMDEQVDDANTAANSDSHPSIRSNSNASDDGTLQSYHVVLSYSCKVEERSSDPPSATATATASASGSTSSSSAASSTSSSPSSPLISNIVVKTKQVGILGARIGRSSDCDIVLPGSDGSIDDVQSEVVFENGKFFLRDINPAMDRGLWSRLSLRSEESLPHQLYNGDKIKVGLSEFGVSIRCIPPPLSLTAAASVYEIGTALEGNFAVQKEMQDRLVAIGCYGGHPNQAYLGVFDGHQERTVADFAAAALHQNLLEELALLQRRAELELDSSLYPKLPSKSPIHSAVASPAHSAMSGSSGHETPGTAGQRRHKRSKSNAEARASRANSRASSTASVMSPEASTRDMKVDGGVTVSGVGSHPSLPPLMVTSPISSPFSHSLTPRLSAHVRAGSGLVQQLQTHIHRVLEAEFMTAIKQAYTKTSQQIKGMGDAASYGGCTAVSVVVWYHPLSRETKLYAANVGDSRALLIREGGRPELLSHLHIGRDASEQERVKKAGGRIMSNGRLAGCLEVTRAFGDLGMVSFGLISTPYIMETTLLPTDSHLIVSSDGLFDVLSYDETAKVLVGSGPEVSAQQLAFVLIEMAMKRKAHDNLSVIIVKLQKSNVMEMGTSLLTQSDTSGSSSSTGSLVSNIAGSKTEQSPPSAAEQLIRPMPRMPSRPSLASMFSFQQRHPDVSANAGTVSVPVPPFDLSATSPTAINVGSAPDGEPMPMPLSGSIPIPPRPFDADNLSASMPPGFVSHLLAGMAVSPSSGKNGGEAERPRTASADTNLSINSDHTTSPLSRQSQSPSSFTVHTSSPSEGMFSFSPMVGAQQGNSASVNMLPALMEEKST